MRIANKRLAVLFLCLLFLLQGTVSSAEGADHPPSAFFHLPVIEDDSRSSSGLKATWSCVYFGSYPSAEVVNSAWDSVDDYALQEGDLIRDDALYARLEAADWQTDILELDGISYLRIGLDRAPASGGTRKQHYRWDYSLPWHYFRIQPVRWRILDLQDHKALLLADRMPDCVPFHGADADTAWDRSTLRSWLNGYGAEANDLKADYTGNGFIDRAFTPREREAILPSPCRNPANRDYGTGSGTDTEDCLFILSNEEVFEGENAGRYGFFPGRDYDDPAKRFTSTLYAKCRGAWWSPVDAYAGNSFWFMRTSGYTPRSVTYICDFGYIYSKGTLVTCDDAGVLPAMWIDLDKAELTEAGETVSTDIIRTSGPLAASFPVPDIGNPVITADDTAPGGCFTRWNAVAFGHYPQTEILREPSTDGNSGTFGNTEADPELFAKLEAAAGDSGSEVTIGSRKYIRLESRWFRCDPIIWRVLEVADGTALLLADQCLDCAPYHTEYRDVAWEQSDLRSWLNGTLKGHTDVYGARSFTETAFTGEELRSLMVSAISNESNYYYGTGCGSGTRDRVFLLSEEDVFHSEKAKKYGFRLSDSDADPGRKMRPTAYAAARGAWQSVNSATAGIGFWFLRTNGYTRDNVVYAGEKGYLYNRGIPVTCPDAGIVPAIRIRLGLSPVIRVEDISTRPD